MPTDQERPPFELDLTRPALTPPATFAAMCADFGVQLEPSETQRLGLYLAHLLDANTRMNLTGITDPEEAWTTHAFDALTLDAVLADLPQ